MKIVFLDFDGVLNSDEFIRANATQEDVAGIDPTAVAVLNEIVERSGASVVVSSTWRIIMHVNELTDRLVEAGFRGRVLDVTPDHKGGDRGIEIQAWLDENGEHYGIESFVILDDDKDMAHLMDRLVQTSFTTGLRPEHIPLTLAQLTRPR